HMELEMTLVMKFGGTSVGSAEAMQETAVLITDTMAQWGAVVVVASAMGSKPIKVTDLLLNGAYAAADGDLEQAKNNASLLREIHKEAIDGLLSSEREAILAENGRFIDRFESLCQAVCVLGELSPRALDTIGGMGERMSVRILAAYLREQGHPAEAVDATELILTDSHFQDASPNIEGTKQQTEARIRPLLEQKIIPIVTGFIGADQNGVQTTLGRGGSDYSGAILGQVLEAKEVWIWTDVDGVMTTDPRIVDNARSIPELSFREVSELAYYGARVLHPKTMRPCVENNIPLRIKNTFNPEHPGTVIVPKRTNQNGGIKAVTAIKDLSLITVEGKGMLGIPGIAARTFGAVANTNQSILLISQASSEQSICFTTPGSASQMVVAALNAEFAKELVRRDIDSIQAQNEVSIVTVVGAGMRGLPGVAGKVFTALGNASVNIIAIAQGSSECSISVVVEQAEAITAVQSIHALI
ncbi:MAG: aspartate kinase, partial [Chloroflexota bacterium]